MQQTTLKTVVVEPDAAMRLYLTRILTELGCRIAGVAANGAEMLRIVPEAQPDLILFDILLPDLSGLDTFKQLAQARLIAGVVVTSVRDSSMIQRVAEERIFGYLVKPIEAHHLVSTISVVQARFIEYQSLTNENNTLKVNLSKRKIIERAKGLLMSRYQWSEEEAFRRLQRGAMNCRRQMVDLAQDILNNVEIHF